MLIAVCSDKGSPGATTTALVLASVSAGHAVVVEADLAGGDLGLRLRTKAGLALPETPTVLTVASTARARATADPVGRHAHPFTKAVSVIPGALFAEQTRGVSDWMPLADALTTYEHLVFADLGRLQPGSPVMPVAAAADVVIMVGRPDATSFVRMRERLSRLAPEIGSVRGAPPRLFPVLVAPSRHARGHLADLRLVLRETAAQPFLVGSGSISVDPAAVRRLENGEEPNGRLARTGLLRSARVVTDTLGQIGEAVLRREAAARMSGAGL